MKIWFSSLCCLFTFLAAGYLAQASLDRTARQLDHKLDEAELNVRAGNWDQSLQILNNAKQSWDKAKPFWAVLTNHKEIDLIDEALTKTLSAASGKSYIDTLIHIETLRDSIKHVPEKERLTLINVF